jgi:hypothetical protein
VDYFILFLSEPYVKDPWTYLDKKYNSNGKKAYSHPGSRNLEVEVRAKLYLQTTTVTNWFHTEEGEEEEEEAITMSRIRRPALSTNQVVTPVARTWR